MHKRDAAQEPANSKLTVATGWISGASKMRKGIARMSPRKSRPHPLKSSDRDRRPFKTGEAILESGLYRVRHRAHRLPHEVGLYRGQLFPRCERCHGFVSFELLRAAPAANERPESSRIHLFELPAIEKPRHVVSSKPAA